jgi:phage baseplate assembly protein W
MSVHSEFIGSGWAFPLRTDATGSMALVNGDREIGESIRLILATAPGERPMRPEFGCAIHDLVFAPADAATAGRIAYEVRLSLERWEPRIDLMDVIVSFQSAQSGILLIDVRYALRGNNDPRNLVFPFYVIPSREDAASAAEAAFAGDTATSIREGA